jgi:hypothetical protein
VPSSAAACVEVGRDGGGYSGYIARVVADLKHDQSHPSGDSEYHPPPIADVLERRLSSITGSKFTSTSEKIAELDALYATKHVLTISEGVDVVHRASVITELGMKARIITVPPAHIFARGDLVRQVVWPAMLSRIPQILPYAPHTEDGILARLGSGLGGGGVFVSADLTCATDGFGHDAIIAVVDGLRKAGLPSFLDRELRESLGVGNKCHKVSYKLSDLSQEEVVYAVKHYPVVDGRVQVEKTRGSLMGTPCSFIVLSLLNHWMSENLGSRRIICGDDLAALTHADNVSLYSERASLVGSKLHDGKSYRSRIGFVFCEAYALLDKSGNGVLPFRPPSLKEFVREGNGVMNQTGVDSSSFNRLARCAKTIYRTQRKIATKLQRPPELPASLGGLGHPCKGRLRVPLWCRAALAELYLCTGLHGLRTDAIVGSGRSHLTPHDPTEFIRPLRFPAVPSNRVLYRKISKWAKTLLLSRKVDEPQPTDTFLPFATISAYASIGTNLVYLNKRGLFRKVRPEGIRVGKQRWPKPCPGTGILSTHTRIVTVLEWDRRARCELGHYFPPDFSAHVRGRTSAYRNGDIPGDDRY